ncbi:hypothetical protein ACFL2Q_18235 [Thermodesulfobacteriota bacterium]
MNKIIPIAVCLSVVISWMTIDLARAQREAETEPMKFTAYYISPRLNYLGARWVFQEGTHKLIGFAHWDEVNRRFTVFDLQGKYYGFYQATVDGFYRGYFRQFVRYGDENRYDYAITVSPGGRPIHERNPYGELGGVWIRNSMGNITLPDTTPKPDAPPTADVDALYYND